MLKETLEHLVAQVMLEHLGYPGYLDPKETEENLDREENLDSLDPLEELETLECQYDCFNLEKNLMNIIFFREKSETRELQDQKDFLELKEHMA